jgi:hypothetical protein
MESLTSVGRFEAIDFLLEDTTPVHEGVFVGFVVSFPSEGNFKRISDFHIFNAVCSELAEHTM